MKGNQHGGVQAAMRPLLFAIGFAAVGAISFATGAGARLGDPPPLGGFRCDNGRIVRNGESQGEVSRKCGAPDFTNTWSETQTETILVAGRYVTRQVTITFDEWEYD